MNKTVVSHFYNTLYVNEKLRYSIYGRNQMLSSLFNQLNLVEDLQTLDIQAKRSSTRLLEFFVLSFV